MMFIVGQVLNDSVREDGKHRLTSVELTVPSVVLPDLISTRACSVSVRVRENVDELLNVTEQIEFLPEDNAIRTAFGEKRFVTFWQDARKALLQEAGRARNLPEPPNLKLLESLLAPFSHSDIVITASDWKPLRTLAEMSTTRFETSKVWDCIEMCLANSTPFSRPNFAWHLPYIADEDIEPVCHFMWDKGAECGMSPQALEGAAMRLLCKVAAVRCHRVSRELGGRTPTFTEELELYDALTAYPRGLRDEAEHIAFPAVDGARAGHLPGWITFKDVAAGEYVETMKRTSERA